MKGLMLILAAATGWFTCTEAIGSSWNQTAGFEITSAFREHAVCMTFGYVISDKWSADINACIGKDIFARKFSNDELKHSEEFTEDCSTTSTESENMTPSFRMALRHWTITPYEGGFFSGGAVFRHDGRHDLTAGAGYSFRIYKHLGGAVIYEMELLETYRYSIVAGNDIRIEIFWRF